MISVIIPTYNSSSTIKKTLDSILNQSYEGEYEVIVVDSSKDDTPWIVKQYPVTLIETGREGPGKARNIGADNAKGRIIAFTDADCKVDRDWLKVLVEEIEKNGADAAGGLCATPKDVSLLQRLIGFEIDYRFDNIKEGPVNRLPTMNLAVKKSVFDELGGFNTDLITSEDFDFGYRLKKKGYSMVFNKKAIIYHYHRTSLKSYARQKFNSGSYVTKSYSRNPSGLKGDQINSFLMVLQPFLFGLLGLSIIGSVFVPTVWPASIGIFVLLSLTFIYRTLRVTWHFKDPKALLLFFLYWYWATFMTLGIMNGLLRNVTGKRGEREKKNQKA